MKKWLLILGMITCMVGLTACGKTTEVTPMMSENEATEFGKQVVEALNQYDEQQTQTQAFTEVFLSGVENWKKSTEDMGNYESIIGTDADISDKDCVINVKIKCSKRNANVEIVLTTEEITSITTNVEYTFGEKMEKAGLNTLLGMGTVFSVLILISLIISCFSLIPKIQAMFNKKPAKEEIKKAAVDNTIAQIIEKEELSDDLELVAVISAAIAASQGAASTDGFVVRSIRRAGNKW